MKLEKLLKDKRDAFIAQWAEAALRSHSIEAAKFSGKADQFSNPIAYTVRRELAELYDNLVGALSGRAPAFSLDAMIKIRAVQDFSAAEAVSFPFRFKEILRREFRKETRDADFCRDLLALESLIDEIALLAFSRFAAAREQLFDMKLRELRSGVFSNQPDVGCPAGMLDQWDAEKEKRSTPGRSGE